MKLIIDIPDNIYQYVMNTGTYGHYRFESAKAIRNGIPLDNIRAEIEQLRADLMTSGGVYEHSAYGLDYAMRIINKYKAKSEG